jgi:V8-like Glu-specific endopeptidase
VSSGRKGGSRGLARLRWCGALALLAGCGPADPGWTPALGSLRQAIIGGTLDATDANVFVLIVTFFNSSGMPFAAQGICSATLIGSRSLLTAAHCTDPAAPDAPAGAQSLQVAASNIANLSGATASDFTAAVRADFDPSYDFTVEDADIGMVLLPQPPGPTPKPWNTADLSGAAGQTMRVIGYGQTSSTDTNPAARREVNLPLESPLADRFQVGNGQGTCHGDSGGPSMLTGSDGVERVVGVHAYGPNDCSGAGEDMRVDFNQTWINSWLSQYDPPATLGQACVAGQTVCVPGTACTGPVGAATFCQQPCVLTSDCPGGDYCAQGSGSLMFCRKDPITEPFAAPLLGAEPSGGCAAAGGGLAPLSALALVGLRNARRRRAPARSARG